MNRIARGAAMSGGSAAAMQDWIDGFLFGEREVHGECHGWILAVVRHRAWGLRQDEEDVVQEVKLKLLGLFEAGTFRGASSLKTFVQAVAKHSCLDALRRARVRAADPFSEEQFPSWRDHPANELERQESARLCYDVLAHLPGPCRELFRLLLVDDRSYEEIAGELGLAIGTVKSRLARCRDRALELREVLSSGWRGRKRALAPGPGESWSDVEAL